MTDKMDKSSDSKKSFVKECMDFLQTFGVIGLAIGFIIGVASGGAWYPLLSETSSIP